MGGVVYSTTVVARNEFGRFIRDCEQAAENTVEDTVSEGADVAAMLAPKRTLRLASSIKPFMLSRTSGVWGSNVPYAAAQERGAVPHPISAYVSFYWQKAGRKWMHPDLYRRVTGGEPADPIWHPGNPARNFMRDSQAIMKRRMMAIARVRYPG